VPCQDLPEIDLYEWLDRRKIFLIRNLHYDDESLIIDWFSKTEFCVVDHRVINLGKTKRITPCVSCTCTAEGVTQSILINFVINY